MNSESAFASTGSLPDREQILDDVGLPGKSGMGGGTVTVSPGKGGLGTLAPL